jgi:FtsP/CotA-like multicopper oxidase with cupredoxin domain
LIGALRYGLQSSIPSNFSTLSLPQLHNETELRDFAVHERYQTLLAIEKMPAGNQGRPDVELVLHSSQDYVNSGGEIRWFANNGTFDMMRLKTLNRSLLLDLANGNNQTLPNDIVYSLGHNQLVDIVIQNSVALNGVCESHPMHMHGHKFWIHSYGVGKYDPALNIWPDRHDPVLRDSLMVYASSDAYFSPNRSVTRHREACGWTKLRMITNNPGLWMFHCHIAPHAVMGMNVLLKEDTEHLILLDLE